MSSFHPDAVKNFDDKGEKLLTQLTPYPATSVGHRAEFVPDFHVAATIPEKEIIGNLVVTPRLLDRDGEEVGRYFEIGNLCFGLIDEPYRGMVNLVDAIWRSPAVNAQVSRTFLADSIFAWIQHKLEGHTQLTMTEHILADCKNAVGDFELWFPVAHLNIESEIKVGPIEFKTISREMLDVWQARVPCFEDEETNVKIKYALDRERHSLLGFAAATIRVHAESRRAYEIGLEEADRATSLLRFFSPANSSPKRVSHCNLLGREHLEGLDYLRVEGDRIVEHTESATEHEPSWRIGKTRIAEISPALLTLGALLDTENQSEFKNVVLAALLLYSRSSLAKTYSDKLVYQLAALDLLPENSANPK